MLIKKQQQQHVSDDWHTKLKPDLAYGSFVKQELSA